MVEYYGVYGPFIRQYIDFKKKLGYKFEVEHEFVSFDRLTVANNVKTVGLTRELAEKWSKKRPNESEANRYKRVNRIKNFSIFLNHLGYSSYVPRSIRKPASNFTPYIFSKDEIHRFFLACDSIRVSSCYASMSDTVPAVFRLIYGCGLRANEALSLRCKDVCLKNKYIIIHNSKNQKDRLLPLSDSLALVLNQYKSCYLKGHASDNYFFTKKNKKRHRVPALYYWFRKILFEANISHGGKGLGPRVHDFRHSFSVHSLAAMSKFGLDLYYSLPVLSKYLGHTSLEATDKYVRLTSEMYPELSDKINELCSYVFPEVDKK